MQPPNSHSYPQDSVTVNVEKSEDVTLGALNENLLKAKLGKHHFYK